MANIEDLINDQKTEKQKAYEEGYSAGLENGLRIGRGADRCSCAECRQRQKDCPRRGFDWEHTPPFHKYAADGEVIPKPWEGQKRPA